MLIGIFVGGASRRMGRPKGNLAAPGGQTLLVRTASLASAFGEVVLVGDATPYEGVLPELPRVPDDPPNVGPLAGLAALLSRAEDHALALAVDHPHLDASALQTLVNAPAADVVAAREEGRWQPLVARYHARVLGAVRAQLTTGDRSFQALLRRLEVHEVELSEGALVDWDHPEDLP